MEDGLPDASVDSRSGVLHPRSSTVISRRALLALWLLVLPLMLIGIGRPEVTRTQEARVLEVARQAMGHPLIDWIVPKINGELRLQKPPLAYWMTGIAYAIGGVSEGVGRVPTAIIGWLTLGVTYCAAKWLFGSRAGFIAASTLMGSYFFARHTRLAETDAPAMLFVTLSIYAMWRGVTIHDGSSTGFQPVPEALGTPSELGLQTRSTKTTTRRSAAWLHLGAACVALSIMSKGGPGAFPIVFLVAYAIVERRRDAIARFITSGSILTLALLAAPWFLFVGSHAGWRTFIYEMRNVQGGFDHHAPPTYYLASFAVATAPWMVIAYIALIAAMFRWRDPKLRGLLLWFGSIVLPLCFIGNKQNHYLIPALPVAMILVGWVIDRAIETPRGAGQIVRITLRVMLLILALGAVGMPFVSRARGETFSLGDLLLAGMISSATACVALAWLTHGQGRGFIALTVAFAALLPPLVTLWIPTVIPEHTRETAHLVRESFGDAPLCCYGANQSVPLCFNLRQAIPYANSDEKLGHILQQDPDAVIFTIGKEHRPSTTLGSERFETIKSMQVDDQAWDFYRLRHDAGE